MGWGNPPVSWAEMEKLLSGRPSDGPSLQGRGNGTRKAIQGDAALHGPTGGRGEVDGPGTIHRAAPPATPHAPPRPPREEHYPGDGGDSPAWSRKRSPYRPPGGTTGTATAVPYAELHTHSNFSFLDGASHPEELVEEAARLGLEAIALTDHDGMYGVVRFAEAAAELGVATVYGAELSLGLPAPQNGEPDPAGEHLLVLAHDPEGYRAISRTITEGQMHTEAVKGRPVLDLERAAATLGGHVTVLTGCRKGPVRRALAAAGPDAAARELDRLVALFGADAVAVELTDHGLPDDVERNDTLAALAAAARGGRGLPVVATTAAHYATPDRARLAAALGAVRARRGLDEAEGWLPPGTAHLRSGAEMAARFARHPDAVARAAALGRDCAFALHLLAPELPPCEVPTGHTEASWLRELTMRGAGVRYGDATRSPRAYEVIAHELGVIEGQGFPGYFLIVADIVDFCRNQDIYCQGRGSAANSAVCFALGITHVDAVRMGLLFERFLSPERDGYPDIDLDIESDRREEVIQYVYARYGRSRAAQVANVITYRPRSAVRDAARALGFAQGQQDAWSKQIDRWSGWAGDGAAELAGQVPEMPAAVSSLAGQIVGFPRHLGIHSGGDGHLRPPGRPGGARGVGADARAQRHPVGQGRRGRGRAGQVRPARAGHALGAALRLGPGRRPPRPAGPPARPPAGGGRRLRHARHGRLGRGVPGRVPRPDGDAAPPEAPGVLRPGRRGRADPARPDPGWLGAPLHLGGATGSKRVIHDHPLLRSRRWTRRSGVPLFQEQLMQIAVDVGGFSRVGRRRAAPRHVGPSAPRRSMERLRERLFYAGMAANDITGVAGREDLREDAGVRQLRLPGEPLDQLRRCSSTYSAWFKLYHPSAFCVALLQLAADGFLLAAVAGGRRAPARRAGARAPTSTVSVRARGDPPARTRSAWAAGRDPAGHRGTVRGARARDSPRRSTRERDEHGPFRDLADLAGRVRPHRARRPRRSPPRGRSAVSGSPAGRRCGRPAPRRAGSGWCATVCATSGCPTPRSASTPRRCPG